MDTGAPSIKHTVIVPAYNEEAGLAVVLEKIFGVVDGSFEVIVVDDGSTDSTADVASRYPCRVIRHKANLGKGEALKTGFRHAHGDNVIWIDADDTYPVHVIPAIAKALAEYDMVVGSRLFGRGNIPLFNRIGNWIFRTAIRQLYGFEAFDPLTGLWGLRREFAQPLSPTVRFAPDAEMAMKAARMRLRVLDIPIQYRGRIGRSKLRSLIAGYEHAKLIITLLSWTSPQATLDEAAPSASR